MYNAIWCNLFTASTVWLLFAYQWNGKYMWAINCCLYITLYVALELYIPSWRSWYPMHHPHTTWRRNFSNNKLTPINICDLNCNILDVNNKCMHVCILQKFLNNACKVNHRKCMGTASSNAHYILEVTFTIFSSDAHYILVVKFTTQKWWVLWQSFTTNM